jgi:hypothetical protein
MSVIALSKYVSVNSSFAPDGLPDMSQYLTDDDFSSFSLVAIQLLNAAQWRAQLGAAASGNNSDITQLLGLTTPLSISQGGTGRSGGIIGGYTTNPVTQTSNFTLTNEYYLWPVNLASGAIVAQLEIGYPDDFEVIVKAIDETGGSYSLSLATAVDGQTVVINTASGWVNLYFSTSLNAWSIVG